MAYEVQQVQRAWKFFLSAQRSVSPGSECRRVGGYSFLKRCENRKTHRCWPSIKTIGQAVRMSENTVRKYIRQLEERGLITAEPTEVITKTGEKRNGNLLFASGRSRRWSTSTTTASWRNGVDHRATACGETPARAGKPRVTACESLYALIVGGAGALPLPAVSSRIKAGVADGSFSLSQLPAVRAVTEFFR